MIINNMRNNSVKNNTHQGFILIITLLLLSILSLLALCMLEINLLENKTSVLFQDKVNSFYEAEKYLLEAEQQIKANGLPRSPNIEGDDLTSSFPAPASPCKIFFYRLKATGNYRGTTSVLWSTFLKVVDVTKCTDSNLTAGRQAFWVES